MSPHVNGEICPLPSASPPPSPKGEGKENFGLYKDCYVIPSSGASPPPSPLFRFYNVILTLSEGEVFLVNALHIVLFCRLITFFIL